MRNSSPPEASDRWESTECRLFLRELWGGARVSEETTSAWSLTCAFVGNYLVDCFEPPPAIAPFAYPRGLRCPLLGALLRAFLTLKAARNRSLIQGVRFPKKGRLLMLPSEVMTEEICLIVRCCSRRPSGAVAHSLLFVFADVLESFRDNPCKRCPARCAHIGGSQSFSCSCDT